MIEKVFKDVTIITFEQQDLGDPGGKSFILLILYMSTYLNVFTMILYSFGYLKTI